MSAFIIILGYVLVICEILWYFTCTKHEDVPFILVLIATMLSLIPGLNIILSVAHPCVLHVLKIEGLIELKNNWFNRKFLAYRE